MVMLILVGLAVFIVWSIVSANSKSSRDEIVIETKRHVEAEDGTQRIITRKTVLRNNQTRMNNLRDPVTPPVLQPIQPRQVQPQKAQQQAPVQAKLPLEPKQVVKKLCSHCNQSKPISQFRPNPNQPDGLTKWCNTCMDKRQPAGQHDQHGMKYCPKCKQQRRKSSFYASNKYPDGLSKWCKYCLKK
ncbi:hypothetical protein [Kingella negevensis]|uniref:hypothetical protein n=1 Tax=Kingella negevensis TaxID=1522312 RepID=UPI00050A2DBB|nr:hypothetical protein [Kingella negevensis]